MAPDGRGDQVAAPATLLAKGVAMFTDDIAHADENLLATFRQRGAWDRLKEHATHLVWRVL